MAWKIETVESKCVFDQSWFRKDGDGGEEFRFSQDVVYRWGYIIVEDDPREAIAAAHWRGEPLEVSGLAEIDHSYDDGVSEYRSGVENLPDEEKEQLADAADPEDAGWESDDSKTFFRGTLRVTEVADESPDEPVAGGVGPVDFDPSMVGEAPEFEDGTQAAEVIRLLAGAESASVQQGIALLRALDEPALWTALASGVRVGADGALLFAEKGIVGRRVGRAYRGEVALWALRATGALETVTTLELSSCDSLTSLDVLSDCHQLQSLHIVHPEVLTSLSGLTGCRKLSSVSLWGCDALTSLADLESCAHLETLHIWGGALNDLVGLGRCARLKTLHLSGCNSLTHLRGLAGCPHLETLRILGCDALASLEGLEECSRLRTLHVSSCKALPSLRGLDRCSELQELRITWCTALTSLQGLEGCSRLRTLDLSLCSALTSVRGLERLAQLETLDLSLCVALTDLEGLEGCTSLRELDLDGCQALLSIDALENCGALQALRLRHCPAVTHVAPLANCEQLRTLDLRESHELQGILVDEDLWDEESPSIGAEDLDAIREFLGTPALEQLVLADAMPESDAEADDASDEASDEAEPEESWKATELREVAADLECRGFRPGSPGWLRRVLAGYDPSDTLAREHRGPHFSRIKSVIELSDGTLVSSSEEGVLRFWDVSTRRCRRALDVGASMGGLVALRDRRFLADIGDACTVWETDGERPTLTLDHGGVNVASIRMLPNGDVATTDWNDRIRTWDPRTWTCRRARAFEGLRSFHALDAHRLLVLTGTVDVIWDLRTDSIWTDEAAKDTDVTRPSVAVLPDARWASVDAEARIRIRSADGTIERTIDLALLPADTWQWEGESGSAAQCGACAIAAFGNGTLAVWGQRRADETNVFLLCNPETGASHVVHAGGGLYAEAITIDEHSMLVGLPMGERHLVVFADDRAAPVSLIGPSGLLEQAIPRGAIRLRDGRLVTWSSSNDHALRIWSADGLLVGSLGTTNRFRQRDALEAVLTREPA